MTKTDITPKRNTPVSIHASGALTSAAPGILEGAISFPGRGKIRFRMERRWCDEAAEQARLYALTPGLGFAYLHMRDGAFCGSIRVEGYAFGVRVQQDDGAWGVSFLDRGRSV